MSIMEDRLLSEVGVLVTASEPLGDAGEGIGGAQRGVAEAAGEAGAPRGDLRRAAGEEDGIDRRGRDAGAVEQPRHAGVELVAQRSGKLLELGAAERLVDVDPGF